MHKRVSGDDVERARRALAARLVRAGEAPDDVAAVLCVELKTSRACARELVERMQRWAR